MKTLRVLLVRITAYLSCPPCLRLQIVGRGDFHVRERGKGEGLGSVDWRDVSLCLPSEEPCRLALQLAPTGCKPPPLLYVNQKCCSNPLSTEESARGCLACSTASWCCVLSTSCKCSYSDWPAVALAGSTVWLPDGCICLHSVLRFRPLCPRSGGIFLHTPTLRTALNHHTPALGALTTCSERSGSGTYKTWGRS